jgi:hypothetical protein
MANAAPPNAPDLKLKTAAITARIEGMLNAGRD